MKVLLQGGPRDGEHVDVPDGRQELLVPLPVKLSYRCDLPPLVALTQLTAELGVGRYRPSGRSRYFGPYHRENNLPEFIPIWTYDE